jgi:hypothetical protein
MLKLIKEHFIKFTLLFLVLVLDVFVIYYALTPSNKDITFNPRKTLNLTQMTKDTEYTYTIPA